MTTAPIYPQAEPWTVDDLDGLPEYLHAEILDGSLIVSPPPTVTHQVAATRLAFQIQAAMPADREVIAPAGVQVLVNYLIPDVAVVAASAVDAKPMRLDPADVLLVAEVISPSNAGIDRREKPLRYAEVGIPHLWRIELEGDRSPYVVRFGLRGGTYRELGTVHAGAEETVDIGFPVTLRPAELTGRRR
ncbi:MAG TPA: Uma2 family endonuclease [Mycobacteriales bacterium]|nr:Uma2 family endonuclease [Mycobacteriales bacterium]